MKILMIAHMDTGGVLNQLRKAINRSEHECRFVLDKRSYVDTGCDINYNFRNHRQKNKIIKLAKEADVFHFNIGDERDYFPHNRLDFAPYMKGKIVLRHFRGSWFRKYHKRYYSHCRKNGYYCIVSTPDLMNLIDEDRGTFMPNIFDDSLYNGLVPPYDTFNKDFCFVHSPTMPEMKGTDKLLETIKDIQDEHDAGLLLIQNKPRMECLRYKMMGDVLFDQFGVSKGQYTRTSVRYAYGNNAIEAFALGMPAMGELNEKTRQAYSKFAGMECPIVQTTPETLYDDMERMILDEEFRKDISKQSRKYYEKCHSPERIVKEYLKIIERAKAL